MYKQKLKKMIRPCLRRRFQPFFLRFLFTLAILPLSECSYSLTVQSESEECFAVRTPGKGKSLIRYAE
jgi:hypothetical protein